MDESVGVRVKCCCQLSQGIAHAPESGMAGVGQAIVVGRPLDSNAPVMASAAEVVTAPGISVTGRPQLDHQHVGSPASHTSLAVGTVIQTEENLRSRLM